MGLDRPTTFVRQRRLQYVPPASCSSASPLWSSSSLNNSCSLLEDGLRNRRIQDQKTIQFLAISATAFGIRHPSLASLLMRRLRVVSEKGHIDLDQGLTHKLCGRCDCPMIPTFTCTSWLTPITSKRLWRKLRCQVKTQPRDSLRNQLVLLCDRCGAANIRPGLVSKKRPAQVPNVSSVKNISKKPLHFRDLAFKFQQLAGLTNTVLQPTRR